MHNVTVKRQELLGKIRRNRDNHRKVFEEAIIGYRKQVITELDSMLTDAKNGKRIRRSVALMEPVDQTDEYDRVIAMLEMSVDENIILDSTSFSNYVLDKWSWTDHVSTINSTYLSH